MRPAIDVLFRSAAVAFGPRVIGVVLSGMLDDGTAGLWAIKDRGGLAIVQLPEEARYPSMPQSALAHVAVDHTVGVAEMPGLLERLIRETKDMRLSSSSDSIRTETQISRDGNALQRGVMNLGTLSPNTCPACGGVLVAIREGSILRFRCHTGHAFSLKSLVAEVNEKIDDTLWSAMRAVEERALLLKQMGELARASGDDATADRYAEGVSDSTQRAQRIREMVLSERNSERMRTTETSSEPHKS
jgi:two-component system chemotaxis response regulator CheB